jgi:hypothetical protein
LRARDRRCRGAGRGCAASRRDPRLLATSREPLQAEGECVYPVPPLGVPAEDADDADDLLRYGGVRLFVERLRAADPHFAPDRGSAVMIAAICRQLDGIPLAIELAAARASSLGVEEVTTHLDDRFRILTGGRPAMPWDEYIERCPEGYHYSRFCELYRGWASRLSVTLRQAHIGGDKLFVDYAGDTVPVIVDQLTGQVRPALIFVGVMGASNFTPAFAGAGSMPRRAGPRRWPIGSAPIPEPSQCSAGCPTCWCRTTLRISRDVVFAAAFTGDQMEAAVHEGGRGRTAEMGIIAASTCFCCWLAVEFGRRARMAATLRSKNTAVSSMAWLGTTRL